MQKICGKDGYRIKTIFNSAIITFGKPYLIYDVMKPREIAPKIETYTSEEIGNLKTIENQAGITLWQIKLEKNQTWAPRQKYKYYLRKSDLPEDSNSTRVTKFPANHVLQVDEANRKIRIVGPYLSPNKNKSEWIYY